MIFNSKRSRRCGSRIKTLERCKLVPLNYNMEKVLIYVLALVVLVNGDEGDFPVPAVHDVNPYEHILRVRSAYVCEPGSTKMIECNRCACDNDGSAWSCTRRSCPPMDFSTSNVHNTPVLEAEESYPRTRRFSPQGEISVSNVDNTPVPEAEKSSQSRPRICEPESTKWDGCNNCFCIADGSDWVCTQRSCHWEQLTISNPDMTPTPEAENPAESGPKICEPGSTKMVDCNSCFCKTDGSGWGCTKIGCLQLEITNPDMTSQQPDAGNPSEPAMQICEPGSTKMVDCNRCTCVNDGSAWGCTRRFCPQEEISVSNVDNTPVPEAEKSSQSRPRICEPESTKWDGCNNCFCIADGSDWACTQRSCRWEQLTISNPDMTPTPEAENPAESGSKICEPGSTKMVDCNRCNCGGDGSAWACTKQLCSQEEISISDTSIKNSPDAGNESQL